MNSTANIIKTHICEEIFQNGYPTDVQNEHPFDFFMNADVDSLEEVDVSPLGTEYNFEIASEYSFENIKSIRGLMQNMYEDLDKLKLSLCQHLTKSVMLPKDVFKDSVDFYKFAKESNADLHRQETADEYLTVLSFQDTFEEKVEEDEGEILSFDNFENTPDFDPFTWWRTSARYNDLKDGDLLYIINEVDFSIVINGKKYRLKDEQGIYLGDIDEESFDSILDCAKRLEGTYFSDYFGAKYDCDCSSCKQSLTVDDYCFESHNGKPLCDACAIMCEGCNKYYTKDEGSYEDGFFVCNDCKV